ncbi:MAG: anthranilate phosphoribosyltransferase [Dehalococcoidales bacterium]
MIKEAIQSLVEGNSLTADEAAQVMEEIMEGEVTPAQFGAFVTALRIKGETTEEISGLARIMRAKAIPVKVAGPLIDIVGTGGDGRGTFNISTAVAFVVAGAGLKVAKHGNRAASSKAGSADVLEALGVKLELTAEQVEQCINEVGLGFMFAPSFHPAMKYAGSPRREIGIRTVFNILGPLTNPAGARNYLLGVADASLTEKMATVLKNLGCDHALVVHGEDGTDEISITGKTQVYQIKKEGIESYTVNPEDFGVSEAGLDSLQGGTADENASLLRSILSGTLGPQRDVVLMNTAAALVAGDKAETVLQGIDIAKESLDSGQAMAKLEQLIKLTGSFA